MRSLVVAFVVLFAAPAWAGPEKEVAATELGGKVPVTLTVYRQKQSDGGLKLRMAIGAKGDKKPKSVVVYEGGADDDGPTDKSFRNVTVEPFALPGGKRGARVDFEFQVPGSKKHHQIDTFVVSIDEEKPRVVLEATTRRERDRTKVCHEVEDASLVLDKEGRLFVKPVSALESELNDDDLPIDKTCRGKRPGQTITFKWDGETFLQIDPPPAPTKKPAAEESDD